MIAIAFRFLAGRYHATPWGRHVNEGAVEWPPSPWRILRALIATWKRTLPDVSESEVKPILEKLAEAPPEFMLPPASAGHTRHYMPWFKKGPDDRTLVFDAFVAVSRDSTLLMRWPDGLLDQSQLQILDRILANLNTLGRSESWCEAARLDGEDESDDEQMRVSKPLDASDSLERGEVVRLLCPDPESAFANDHVVTRNSMTTGRGKSKQTILEQSSIYDPAWNLCMETLQFQKERWSDPPGSRWVQYARPRDCFKIEQMPRARAVASSRPSPQVVRFALDSTVLPPVTETLPVAEAARRALIYRLTDVRGRQYFPGDWSRQKHKAGMQPVLLHGVLTGKDEHRKPLTGHAHAYFLPTDEDNDGRIDHLTIVARAGFDADEMRAMDCLREIRPWGRDNVSHPLRVLMLGYGQLYEYHPSFLARCREWVSATPYLATRHAKNRGRDRINLASPQERADFLRTDLLLQIRHVCADLDDDALAQITITPVWDSQWVFQIPSRDDRHNLRPIQFKRFRSKPDDDGGRRLAGAFRMILPLEVQGPMVLGWSSHFGLGLFVPDVCAASS